MRPLIVAIASINSGENTCFTGNLYVAKIFDNVQDLGNGERPSVPRPNVPLSTLLVCKVRVREYKYNTPHASLRGGGVGLKK